MLEVMVRILPRSEEKRLLNGMQRQGGRQASISAAATLALFGAAPASLSRAYAQDGRASAELTTVSIPAGTLEEGLVALGRLTNHKLVYPSALITRKKTAGVAGRLTVKDAVEHLLAQTGLGFTVMSMGTVQISALSVRDQALRAQASIPLDTINVEGGGAQVQTSQP
jgi:iron complex outermembrane recepter protein